MLIKVLKCLVFFLPIFLSTHAFWWGSATTEPPPSPPVMKQIPLTYFRTYTYQQPINHNQMQLPLLSSTDYITNHQALGTTPYFNPMMPIMPMVPLPLTHANEIPLGNRPVKDYASVNVVRSFNNLMPPPPVASGTPEPSTTTTTTTTTTSTTPAPTTTTTTTTTEAPATVEETPITLQPLIKTDSMVNIETTYPAFNRKVFTNHFNINYNRPIYPSPEYNIYKASAEGGNVPSPPTIEFVPCMCPVNVAPAGYPASIPYNEQPSNSIFLAQGRTNIEAESPALDEPVHHAAALNVGIKTQAEVTNLVDDLETANLDGEEQEDVATQNV